MVAFPLDIRTELKLPTGWEDISSDVYVRDTKRIVRGVRDLGVAADPSTLTLTLNNRGGKYSRRNPQSPLFGMIGRNTPVRLSVPSETGNYLQLDGSDDCRAQAAFAGVTGDIDVRWEGAPGWFNEKQQILCGQWDPDSDDRGWILTIERGLLTIIYTHDGTLGTTFFQQFEIPGYIPEQAAVRVVMDTNSVAGQREVRMYWAESLDAIEWNLFGTNLHAGTEALHAPSAPLQVGLNDPTISRTPPVGRCTRMQVRDGIDGTLVADADFTDKPAGSVAFTDSVGLDWTLVGTAEIRDREDRFFGEISSWPTEWTIDGSDVWASVTASGILRRMGQGQKPLDSALRRRIPSGNPLAYWPLEDGQGATQAASGLDDGTPMEVSGMEFAADGSLVSSNALPSVSTDGGSIKGAVQGAGDNGWHVEMVYRLEELPATERTVLNVRLHPGSAGVREVRGRISQSAIKVECLNSLGEVVSWFQHTGDGVAAFTGIWTRLRFWSYQSGANTYIAMAWQEVVTDHWYVVFTPVSGTPGRVAGVYADWHADLQGMSVGHIAAFDTGGTSQTTPGVTIYDGSDEGFTGETAWQRLRRLALEENLSMVFRGGKIAGARVGPQTPDTLLDLLRKVAAADGGILSEDMRRLGLHYRTRASLYNQEPILTLDYTQPGLAPGLQPVDDDEGTTNDVTVQREFGSSARAVLETGPMSVADVGQYDESVTLSLANDEQASNAAAWRLHLGTFDGARYPAVTVMLHKPGAEALTEAVMRVREGDVIRLTNLPPFVSYDDVDLMVLGWSEELDLYRWEVTFTCAPADPWTVGELGSSNVPRADASPDQSLVTEPAGETDTDLVVQTVREPWIDSAQFADEFPLDIRVAGEVMRVSAITAGVSTDSFDRLSVDSWGTSSDGQQWVNTGGSPSDYSVQGW